MKTKNVLIPICTLFLLFAFHASDGQSKDTVSVYGPGAMVRNVKQSRDGSILIAASLAGIFKYDGESFTNLTTKIGAHRFWDVLEDSKGNIWFSTTDSGVYCYNGKSFLHFTTREGLVSNAASCIYEDKAGRIWLGTGGGISCYDGKSFRNFTTKDGLPNNAITVITEDRTGKLWIGTSGEACAFDGKTFTVLKDNDGKAFTNVRGITADQKGNVWFGATIIDNQRGGMRYVTEGLWRYDGRDYINVSERGASAIIEDKKGNIWTTGSVNPNGVGDWTLSRYDQKSLYNKKPTVKVGMSIKKMLCGILEAADGSIWFGSLNGVYRYDGKTIRDFRKNTLR